MFAIGDVTAFPEEKLADRAIEHAELVADHIRRMYRGKSPKHKYTPPEEPSIMWVSLGPSNAITLHHYK